MSLCLSGHHFDLDIVTESINNLSSDNPLEELDLKLSEEQIEMFNNLHIDKDKAYYTPYSGNFDSLKEKIFIFMQDISKTNQTINSDLTCTLAQLIHNIYNAMDSKHLWMSIVASKEINKAYRWHTDVPYRYDACTNHKGVELDLNENQCFFNKEYFVLFTLKGTPTLFYPLSENERYEYLSNLKTQDYNKINAMINENKILTGELGKGYLSLNGAHYGALHSRPSHSTSRLFIGFGQIDNDSLAYFNGQCPAIERY